MHYVGVGLVYKPHNLFAGNIEKCATFLRTFFNRCESEIDVALSQQTFFERGDVWDLCCPMPSWICVDTMVPCPSVINKEGADSDSVHSSQTITFQMMIATSHFFNGIKERSHVFIPLEFKHWRDTRSMWRTAFFSYLDGVWEWVQVTSDHMANHYTLLANAQAAAKVSTPTHAQVPSIALPTECSLAATLLSAQLSHKGGSIRNVKVHPGSSDPLGAWTTWEEYLQLKPGELTPDQIVAVITQNQLKIDRSVARILKMFDWYSTLRLVAVVGCFDH